MFGNFLESLWIFFDLGKFFWSIFLAEFFLRIFLGEIFWKDFFGGIFRRNFLQVIVWIFVKILWGKRKDKKFWSLEVREASSSHLKTSIQNALLVLLLSFQKSQLHETHRVGVMLPQQPEYDIFERIVYWSFKKWLLPNIEIIPSSAKNVWEFRRN